MTSLTCFAKGVLASRLPSLSIFPKYYYNANAVYSGDNLAL